MTRDECICISILLERNIIFLFFFTDEASEKPESILRVEKIAQKDVTFINCDITNKKALDELFKEVT